MTPPESPAPFSAPPPSEGPALTDAQEAQAGAVFRALRCLECSGESIYDSRSRLAKSMRTLIREKLAAGESPDSVTAFFRDRYGDRILMKPAFAGAAAPLWIAPFLFGLGAVAWILRRKARAAASPRADIFSDKKP